MPTYLQTQSLGFKSQDLIEEIPSTYTLSAGTYTTDMDIEQLYKYFDSVKTPSKREAKSYRNGNCTIHSLLK